jgi:hypothetical protein
MVPVNVSFSYKQALYTPLDASRLTGYYEPDGSLKHQKSQHDVLRGVDDGSRTVLLRNDLQD